jgi:hypothetical protein
MERLFQSIGLSESKAKDTLKNSSVSNALQSYILEAQQLLSGDVDKKIGNLLYHLATRSVDHVCSCSTAYTHVYSNAACYSMYM